MIEKTNLILGIGIKRHVQRTLKNVYPNCNWLFMPERVAQLVMRIINASGIQPQLCVQDYEGGMWAYNYSLRTSSPLIRVSDSFLSCLVGVVPAKDANCISLDWNGRTHYSGSIKGDLVFKINSQRFSDLELNPALNFIKSMNTSFQHPKKSGNESLVILEDELSSRVRVGGKMHSTKSFISSVKSDQPDRQKADFIYDETCGNHNSITKSFILSELDLIELKNPSEIAKYDIVSVLSSDLGFLALLYGKAVHVYGTPFYAGWGLTSDSNDCYLLERTNLVDYYKCKEKALAHILKVLNETTKLF